MGSALGSTRNTWFGQRARAMPSASVAMGRAPALLGPMHSPAAKARESVVEMGGYSVGSGRRYVDPGLAALAEVTYQKNSFLWSTAAHRAEFRSRSSARGATWMVLIGPGRRNQEFLREMEALRLREASNFRFGNDPSVSSRAPKDISSATESREHRERNLRAIRLVTSWLAQEADESSETWEELESELDQDRLSARRLWR